LGKTPGALQVKALSKKPGKHRIRPGLYLFVRETGGASWVLRYCVRGRAREKGLGSFTVVPLEQAAVTAATLRLKIKRDGLDPVAAMRADGTPKTFREVALELIEAKRPGWKNSKHAAQWRATLDVYVFPLLGSMRVHEITTEDVLRVLRPVWEQKHETATRIRQRIEAVLDAARARGLRDGENPARWRGHLDKLLPALKKAHLVRHHAAMDWRDVPAFVEALRQNPSVSARALHFCLLTAARTGEVIGARWEEIDLEAKIWTVPGARMKAGRPHRVPLSQEAVVLLRSQPRIEGSPFVFPSPATGRTLSNMALLELLRGMRPGLTVHGLRATFRMWAEEQMRFPRGVCEAALAHTVRDATEAAYQRSDLLDQRRELMEAWARFTIGG
jgi:integrase